MSELSASALGCIVVGVDGSEQASRALRWAARAAASFGSRLIAVHAVGLLEGAGYGGSFDPQVALDELAEGAGVAVREPGSPDQVLLRLAARERADLIVVGHRGMGESLQTLGSTSAAVLAATSVPVVVVP